MGVEGRGTGIQPGTHAVTSFMSYMSSVCATCHVLHVIRLCHLSREALRLTTMSLDHGALLTLPGGLLNLSSYHLSPAYHLRGVPVDILGRMQFVATGATGHLF